MKLAILLLFVLSVVYPSLTVRCPVCENEECTDAPLAECGVVNADVVTPTPPPEGSGSGDGDTEGADDPVDGSLGFFFEDHPKVLVTRATRAVNYTCIYVTYTTADNAENIHRYCVDETQLTSLCAQYRIAEGVTVTNCTSTEPDTSASDIVVHSALVVMLLTVVSIFAV